MDPIIREVERELGRETLKVDLNQTLVNSSGYNVIRDDLREVSRLRVCLDSMRGAISDTAGKVGETRDMKGVGEELRGLLGIVDEIVKVGGLREGNEEYINRKVRGGVIEMIRGLNANYEEFSIIREGKEGLEYLNLEPGPRRGMPENRNIRNLEKGMDIVESYVKNIGKRRLDQDFELIRRTIENQIPIRKE